ncbi:MAG TPA: tetratricopeptide repeat protein [Bryobacterales bacterium]|nr:tetratricopeptide repeat protein [Bryobacterales bacterium]
MRRALLLLLAAASLWAQSQDDLALQSQRGKEAMAAGRFDQAAAIYTALVKALPGNAGLLMNLGMAEYTGGDPRAAVPHFRAALQLESALFPAWLFLGLAHLDLAEPARAIEPLQHALQLDASSVQAHQALAGALFSLDRFAEAAAEYRRLAEADPASTCAWYNLGRSYDALSRRAFADLENRAPDSAYWSFLAAGMRFAQRQYSTAFYLYKQALERMPSLHGAHAAIADIYRRTGHADWAATEAERERSLGPPDCAASPIECEFARGRYQQAAAAALKASPAPEALFFQSLAYNELALEAFERLSRLPPSPELHELRAESERNQGRYLQAVGEWREAVKLAPGHPELERGLAIALHEARDYPAAESLFRRLLARDPASAELNYYLGDSLLNQQHAQEAVPFLKKAIEGGARDPAALPARASLGRAYVESGQAAQATPYLKAALSLDTDGSLHYQLARAYQAAGQAELAKQALAEYQKISQAFRSERQQLQAEVKITPP